LAAIRLEPDLPNVSDPIPRWRKPEDATWRTAAWFSGLGPFQKADLPQAAGVSIRNISA
jgi:hypothetical protein